MKKVFLFVFAAFLFTVPAFAQVNVLDISPELEKQCKEKTQEMVQKMRLNESSYIKLKALNREHMANANTLQQAYSNDGILLREKLQELDLTYEKQLAALLTPEQFEAYTEYKKTSSVARFVAAKDDE